MKSVHFNQLSPSRYRQLLARPRGQGQVVSASVEAICLDVKSSGDAAVRKYNKRFDGSWRENLRISSDEISLAQRHVTGEFYQALEAAATNIRRFHEAQIQIDKKVETVPGVLCWRERRPLQRVGLYVPAGSAPLPSTVLMLGIPAVIAGCSRIVLCSPLKSDATIDPLILAAAQVVGLHEIYAVGGAQAIAAMAYGTESIPKVDKIFGPGNRFVTSAKQQVSADPDGAAIDMIAGPSELLILADETADAEVVAADLLSQAEHDPDAHVLLVTTGDLLAKRVQELLPRLIRDLPRKSIVVKSLEESLIVVADSLRECIEFANDYAPEHLLLNVEQPNQLVPLIKNAGSVFLGPFAPVTAGDYASGTNHTLPTGGSSRWASGLSVESFQKSISFQTISREGLQSLAPVLTTMAEAEGLEAHKRAVEIRENIFNYSEFLNHNNHG